jgi:hypothetical protein
MKTTYSNLTAVPYDNYLENAGWYEILNSRNVRMMWQAVEK